MNKRRFGLNMASGLCVFLTVAVFALMSLVTVVLGAGVYRSVVARAEKSYEVRTAITYVTGKLRSLDASVEIRLEKTEVGNDLLALCETIEGRRYETRIYAHEGTLYEIFAAEDAVFAADEGQVIAAVEAFYVTAGEDGLLCLTAVVDGEEYAAHVALCR